MISGVAVTMVASGSLCVLGAAVSRRRMAIVASVVMMLAMCDMALTGLLQPIVWSFALVLLGIVVAATLRSRLKPVGVTVGALRHAEPELHVDRLVAHVAEPSISDRPSAPPSAFRLGRAFTIVVAMAYLVMAWQVLQHGAAPGLASGSAGSSHSHHSTGPLFGAMMITAAGGLVLMLSAFAATAVIRRRPALLLESTGMALMLAAMLLPH